MFNHAKLLVFSVCLSVCFSANVSRRKTMCNDIPPQVLGDILGPAFNSRYMSIELPAEIDPNAVLSEPGVKRAPSNTPAFYVEEDFVQELGDTPAWITNHLKVKDGNTRSKRHIESTYNPQKTKEILGFRIKNVNIDGIKGISIESYIKPDVKPSYESNIVESVSKASDLNLNRTKFNNFDHHSNANNMNLNLNNVESDQSPSYYDLNIQNVDYYSDKNIVQPTNFDHRPPKHFELIGNKFNNFDYHGDIKIVKQSSDSSSVENDIKPSNVDLNSMKMDNFDYHSDINSEKKSSDSSSVENNVKSSNVDLNSIKLNNYDYRGSGNSVKPSFDSSSAVKINKFALSSKIFNFNYDLNSDKQSSFHKNGEIFGNNFDRTENIDATNVESSQELSHLKLNSAKNNVNPSNIDMFSEKSSILRENVKNNFYFYENIVNFDTTDVINRQKRNNMNINSLKSSNSDLNSVKSVDVIGFDKNVFYFDRINPKNSVEPSDYNLNNVQASNSRLNIVKPNKFKSEYVNTNFNAAMSNIDTTIIKNSREPSKSNSAKNNVKPSKFGLNSIKSINVHENVASNIDFLREKSNFGESNNKNSFKPSNYVLNSAKNSLQPSNTHSNNDKASNVRLNVVETQIQPSNFIAPLNDNLNSIQPSNFYVKNYEIGSKTRNFNLNSIHDNVELRNSVLNHIQPSNYLLNRMKPSKFNQQQSNFEHKNDERRYLYVPKGATDIKVYENYDKPINVNDFNLELRKAEITEQKHVKVEQNDLISKFRFKNKKMNKYIRIKYNEDTKYKNVEIVNDSHIKQTSKTSNLNSKKDEQIFNNAGFTSNNDRSTKKYSNSDINNKYDITSNNQIIKTNVFKDIINLEKTENKVNTPGNGNNINGGSVKNTSKNKSDLTSNKSDKNKNAFKQQNNDKSSEKSFNKRQITQYIKLSNINDTDITLNKSYITSNNIKLNENKFKKSTDRLQLQNADIFFNTKSDIHNSITSNNMKSNKTKVNQPNSIRNLSESPTDSPPRTDFLSDAQSFGSPILFKQKTVRNTYKSPTTNPPKAAFLSDAHSFDSSILSKHKSVSHPSKSLTDNPSKTEFISDAQSFDSPILSKQITVSNTFESSTDNPPRTDFLSDAQSFGSHILSKRAAKGVRQWECESRIRWLDLGPDYFPRYLRSVECTSQSCWYDMLHCKPRSFTIKLLRRKQDSCVPLDGERRSGSVGLPAELRQLWLWEERAVNFCCDCAIN